nr:MAG TPA: hypothetical protein [Caudoviricetes sp.]
MKLTLFYNPLVHMAFKLLFFLSLWLLYYVKLSKVKKQRLVIHLLIIQNIISLV